MNHLSNTVLYYNVKHEGSGVFKFIHSRAVTLSEMGRARGAEILASTLRSFMHFRAYTDLGFEYFDSNLVAEYEKYLKGRGLTRNTTSFYMRNLRAVYNVAVDEGLTIDRRPFKHVYTGVDKTIKRAIKLSDIKALRGLNLARKPHLDMARNLFLFSFYARGMPFIDMAYLRRSNLIYGRIIYRRKKTGQLLTIELTPEMEQIIETYKGKSEYILPIIKGEGDERTQYLSHLSKINRNLKTVGRMIGVADLSSYASRHGWATIAYEMNVPISVISKALGHESERTTQIYLGNVSASAVDQANRNILNAI